MRQRFVVIFLLSTICVCGVTPASARLTGSLMWDYAQYNAKEAGVEVTDATSFAQRYSLQLEKKGYFLNGRGGSYDFSLGGEWFGLSTDIEQGGVPSEIHLDGAKLLYRGGVILAPGGLPFHFEAYARDMHESRFYDDSSFNQGSFDYLLLEARRPTILSPHVVDDVSDGEHMEYGASMVVGIKNGSYLGRYRNIMSHLPKLYVDYRERRVRDLESLAPEHYRERELAFVSLNKKHNWFHYRFFEYKDLIAPEDSYYDRTYLLGTIDQNLRREWVNLTNWIQLSVDGRYSTEVNPRNTLGDETQYALNFFVTTQRSNWRSATFSRYLRYEKIGELERQLEVPFFAEGVVDRDNSWRLRFIGARELTTRPYALVGQDAGKDVLYSTLRWETAKTQDYILAPGLAIERKFGDYGQGGAAKASVEYYSNGDRKPRYDLFSELSLTYFWGTPEGTASVVPVNDTSLVEAVARFDISRRLSALTRAGVKSQLAVGTGTLDVQVTDYLHPETLKFLSLSQGGQTLTVDGTVWRAQLLGFWEHETRNRFSNRLEAGISHIDNSVEQSTQYQLSHRLGRVAADQEFRLESSLLYGDNLFNGVTSTVFATSLMSGEFDGLSFSTQGLYRWTPNRKNGLTLSAGYDWRDPDTSDSGSRVKFTQGYQFVQFAQTGLARRLFELNQYLDYESLDPPGSLFYQAVALSCLVNYYPTSWSRLGSKVRWQRDLEVSTDDVGVGLYSDLDFSLLTLGLEYEYGMRTLGDDGTPLDRDEQRWKISIKKTF